MKYQTSHQVRQGSKGFGELENNGNLWTQSDEGLDTSFKKTEVFHFGEKCMRRSSSTSEPIGQEVWRDWELNLIDRDIEDSTRTNGFKTVDGNLLKMEKEGKVGLVDEPETIRTYCVVVIQTTERFRPGQMEDDIMGLNQ